ncbi:MAG: class I tRNA ligase family protein, partial [Paracoccaceae bacterium]
ALDKVRDGTVKIMPESGEKVYYHWLDNIEPWCISRQLWWGHQIPVWYGMSFDDSGDVLDPLGEHFCAVSFEDAKEKAEKHYKSVLGYDVEVREQNIQDTSAATRREPLPSALGGLYGNSGPRIFQVNISRDPDVLDTWFSSGLWPIGTLGWPEDTDALKTYFPTSTLITGQDILFFWVARMMMMQLAVTKEIPFDTVYLHGLVRDAKGKKMSKSTGNVIDPLDIIDEFGADALRFSSAAMAALGGVLKLDMERIKGYRNFGTKLWNAASYGDMQGCMDIPDADAAPKVDLALNRWIIGEVAKTRETVDRTLTDYRFNDAADALYKFIWGVFCDWYLEFTKPVFNGQEADAIAETKATFAWVLDQCLVLLHPIMPFITEELWQQKQRPKMLVHADWPTYTAADLVDEDADAELSWVVRIIEETRSARAQMHVPAGAYVPMVVTGFTDKARAAYTANEAIIKRLARIESLDEVDNFPKGTVSLTLPGGTFGLPLADVIDVTEEKARLEKTLGKLAKEIGGLNGRLKNPKFIDSAPDEVIAETRANLSARQDEESKLKTALIRLSELD